MAKFFIALCMLFVGCSATDIAEWQAQLEQTQLEALQNWQKQTAIFDEFPALVDAYVEKILIQYNAAVDQLGDYDDVSECKSTSACWSRLPDEVANKAKACGVEIKEDFESSFTQLKAHFAAFADDLTQRGEACQSSEDRMACVAKVTDDIDGSWIALYNEQSDLSAELSNVAGTLDGCAQEASTGRFLEEANANYAAIKECLDDDK